MTAKKSLFWSFLNENGAMVIQIIASLIVARLLSVTELGYMAILQVYSEVAVQLRQFGLYRYIVQSVELDVERMRSALGVMIVTSWGLGLLLIAISGSLGRFYHIPQLVLMMRIVAAGFFLAPFSQPGLALYDRSMRFDITGAINLTSVAVTSVVAVVAALLKMHELSLAIGAFSYQLTSFTLVLIRRHPQQVFIPSFKHWRDVVSFGMYTSGYGLVTTLAAYAPGAILGRVASAATAGIYSRASDQVLKARQMIVPAIHRYLVPTLAQIRRDKGSAAWTYYKTISLTTALAWSGCALLGLLATPVITFLYGAKWAGAGPILTLLCISQGLMVSILGQEDVLFLEGQARRLLRTELKITLIGIANFMFWSHFSVLHAAAGRTLDALLTIIIYGMMLKPIVGIHWAHMRQIYLRSAILALITVSPTIVTLASLHWPNQLPAYILFGLVPISGLAWLAGLRLTQHPIAEDIFKALGAAFKTVKLRLI